jgi:hypothetical protein
MPNEKPTIPAISREIEFIARHTEEADEIRYNECVIEASLKELSDKVYDRANEDVHNLLSHLIMSVSTGSHGLVRIDWKNASKSSWRIYGDIFMARGRKKGIGWVGLNIGSGDERFSLIGWVCPRRGGLDGRLQFARACQKKLPEDKVHLASEDSKRYPGWIGNSDAVVWLDKPLTRKIGRDELQGEVATKAKRFFGIAKSLLKTSAEK